MRLNRWLALILWLLPICGWSAHTIDEASDLPFTTTHTYDTIIVGADSIVSTATGWVITMNHDHCVLDLNGNTLFLYGAVLINADTCFVLNGTIEQHASSPMAEGGTLINIGTSKREPH